MKWEAEGGKGLLWVEIKKRFVQKKGSWYVKKAAFEDSKKLFERAVFWLRKREAFEGKA